ncbi:mechanosensitive ion channel family protein [Salegentibacter sp.]|uniref:mechanosensitive ion channel family protein n=1 Tax=Salegentibacter sp. TaxID=1903072 RepID=UPI00356B5E8A
MKILHNKSLLTFILILFSLMATAQIPGITPAETEEEEEIQEDPLGRHTPRGTVIGFIDAMSARNYSRASRYLEFPQMIRDSEGQEELIQVLMALLDTEGDILPYSLISKEPEGRTDDNLEPELDKIGTVNADGERIDILLVKTIGNENNPIWLFSEESLAVIDSASTTPNSLVDRLLPGFLKNNIWGGVPVGQWIVAVILIALSYLLAWAVIGILLWISRKLWKGAREEPASGILSALHLPLVLYLAVMLFISLSRTIGLSIIIRQKFSALTVIVGITAIVLLLWRLSDFLGKYSQKKMLLRGNPAGVSIVLFLQRAAKIAIVILGIIAILGAVGIDVTTGLAALGIGGIALALGAQKTIENFVGSVTLITDRPIRVGDFCRVGEITGHVEKIGIRSTRIRTLDRTLVTIPNGAFSSDTIENYAHRDKFRFHSVLNFRYETSPDQLRYLLAELRKVLYSHPKVLPEPARIRFIGFASSSLDLEVFAYLNAIDYDHYLEIKEDLMLRMMEVVEKSGSGFAFPSQTLYFAKDHGLNKVKVEEAEEKVKDWRSKNEMPIPKFSKEQIEKLKNTSKYPSEGSVENE